MSRAAVVVNPTKLDDDDAFRKSVRRVMGARTVNERPAIDSLQRLGVHGITTADPRLFV